MLEVMNLNNNNIQLVKIHYHKIRLELSSLRTNRFNKVNHNIKTNIYKDNHMINNNYRLNTRNNLNNNNIKIIINRLIIKSHKISNRYEIEVFNT